MISWFEKINELAGKICALLLIPLVFLIFIEVIARYIFDSPTVFAWDISIQIFSFILMLSGGYTLLHNGHVSVDVIMKFLSPQKVSYLNIFNSTFCILCAIVLIWFGFIIGFESLSINEKMATMWGPVIWPIKISIPIGGFLLLIQGIANIIKEIDILKEKFSNI